MSSSKTPSWHSEIDARRKGAGYFLSQGGRLRFEPAGYVAFRAVPREASDMVAQEWARWLYDLKNSRHEHVRRTAAAASLFTQAHLDEYYKSRLLKKRALAAMESSIEQVTAADSKVTELLYEKFDGKPFVINNTKSAASNTLLFNKEERLAEEGLLDAVATHFHGILPVDDHDSYATAGKCTREDVDLNEKLAIWEIGP